jgi:hypothetical protein
MEVVVGLFSDDRPRRHHYLFAHRELLTAARNLGGRLPELASSGRLAAVLPAAWEQVGSRLPSRERLPDLGLGASLHDLDGISVVLVALPRPEHSAEAYFVAIVVADGGISDYFVLEHGWTTRDEPRTVLCKWDDRGHVNLGDGPPAEADAFLAAVRAHLGPGSTGHAASASS